MQKSHTPRRRPQAYKGKTYGPETSYIEVDHYGKRQPRQPRRQGTRKAAVLVAVREAGI